MLPRRSELPALFGSIADMQWSDEEGHMVFVPVPVELQPFLLMSFGPGDARRPVMKIYANKVMAPALSQAMQNILERGLKAQVHEFGGCFCIRETRGTDRLSVHSWGMAVDINPSTNKLGTPGDMSDELAACFTDAGFIWGKRFFRQDPMHFQYCTED